MFMMIKNEIERKFLLDEKRFNYLINYPILRKTYVEQTYPFYCDGEVLRIRKEGNQEERFRYHLTYKKTIDAFERYEKEIEISEYMYQYFLLLMNNKKIIKDRYLIEFLDINQIVVVDVFYEKYQGLITAEIEFNTRKELDTFTPVYPLDIDVTEDERTNNLELFKHIIAGNAETHLENILKNYLPTTHSQD